MSEPVTKQLCVNQLGLPEELLDIIKSFAFDDIIIYTAKMRKKTIHTLIQCTPWSGQYKTIPRKFLFWIEEDLTCKQFQMYFCSNCGNYDTYRSRYSDKIECKC